MIPRIAAKLKKKKEYIYRITTYTLLLLCMMYCEIFSFAVMWSFIPAMYSPLAQREKKANLLQRDDGACMEFSHTTYEEGEKGQMRKNYIEMCLYFHIVPTQAR